MKTKSIMIAAVALLTFSPAASAQEQLKKLFEEIGKNSGITKTSEQKTMNIGDDGVTNESHIVEIKVGKAHFSAVFDRLKKTFDSEGSHATMVYTHTRDNAAQGGVDNSRQQWSIGRDGASPIHLGGIQNSSYLMATFDDKEHPDYRTCYAAEWSDTDDPDIRTAQLIYVYGHKPKTPANALSLNYQGMTTWPNYHMPDTANINKMMRQFGNLDFPHAVNVNNIPFTGNMDTWMSLAMQRGVSNLSNADWHRFFGLLTEKMMDKANKGAKQDLVVTAGIILDLCKNANQLDADEREVSARRLVDVADHHFDQNEYIYDLLMLGAKKLRNK